MRCDWTVQAILFRRQQGMSGRTMPMTFSGSKHARHGIRIGSRTVFSVPNALQS